MVQFQGKIRQLLPVDFELRKGQKVLRRHSDADLYMFANPDSWHISSILSFRLSSNCTTFFHLLHPLQLFEIKNCFWEKEKNLELNSLS